MVIADPRTGEILAAVSRRDAAAQPWTAVTEPYEPGRRSSRSSSPRCWSRGGRRSTTACTRSRAGTWTRRPDHHRTSTRTAGYAARRAAVLVEHRAGEVRRSGSIRRRSTATCATSASARRRACRTRPSPRACCGARSAGPATRGEPGDGLRDRGDAPADGDGVRRSGERRRADGAAAGARGALARWPGACGVRAARRAPGGEQRS